MTPRDQVTPHGLEGQAGADDRPDGWVTLQRVLIDRPSHLEPLYWRPREAGTEDGRPRVENGRLVVPAGASVGFDTYFNTLFEYQWRLHGTMEGLALALEAEGEFDLVVQRRTRESGTMTLRRVRSGDGARTHRVELPDGVPHPRAAGLISFQVHARAGPVRISGGRWLARPARPPMPVGLGLVFCTFNRERELGRVLAAIAADADALGTVAAVTVVNQGRPGLADHAAVAPAAAALGHRLRIVEQANYGGAGGFTRGLMDVLGRPGVTHAVLMDDDVEAEPEALVRTATFFALAKAEVALGGHMLDLLKPLHLYEAGARIDPRNWALLPIHHDHDLARPENLERFLDTVGMHYNGWWFFALPASFVHRAGLPLPCFIRGDDVEYGRRLHDRGLHTVALPGVAIWHEPFYVKIGGWQLYYETRNMLITAAVHFPPSRRHLAATMLKRLLIHLLTFRYYNAALIVRAMEDFLAGPSILEGPPLPIHEGLAALRARYPQESSGRDEVLNRMPVRPPPRGRVGFVLALARSVLSNWMRPTRPQAPAGWIQVRDLVWFRVGHAEHVAAETYWDPEILRFRRSREHFRELLTAGLRVLRRLCAEWPGLSGRWRTAHPRLTAPATWRRHLGLADEGVGNGAAGSGTAGNGTAGNGAVGPRRERAGADA